MWAILLVAIVVAYMLLKRREQFVLKYGNPFEGEDVLSFERDAKGTRLVSSTPDTCPAGKTELDAGLCYEPCEEGYHGVASVCWADSVNVGTGKIPDLRWFQKDVDFGLFTAPVWTAEATCPKGQEVVTGLCYDNCPRNLPNRIPGMPYLCAKLSRGLSYDRGVGLVPPLFHFGA